MNKNLYLIIGILAIFLVLTNSVFALTIKSVDFSNLSPGKEGEIVVSIENNLQNNVEEVTLALDLSLLPLTPVGSSEKSIDEISEGDKETFRFDVKASNDAKINDYDIPYTITYSEDNVVKTKKGFIGITIEANPELEFVVNTENPVIGTDGKIIFKIVNKGFSDARFVSVKITPQGYTLLSDKEVYIGTVSSDDFETITFDVHFNTNSRLVAQVEYKNFDNSEVIKNVNIPIEVYTRDQAIQLGIVKKSNTGIYTIFIVLIAIIWFLWRKLNKKKRMARARGG